MLNWYAFINCYFTIARNFAVIIGIKLFWHFATAPIEGSKFCWSCYSKWYASHVSFAWIIRCMSYLTGSKIVFSLILIWYWMTLKYNIHKIRIFFLQNMRLYIWSIVGWGQILKHLVAAVYEYSGDRLWSRFPWLDEWLQRINEIHGYHISARRVRSRRPDMFNEMLH